MEIFRKKNVDTRITFPIIDADGDPVTVAAGLDSEYTSYDTADHGAAAPSFGDCGHEATEIGTTGIYYLDVAAAEINKDFTHIQVKTSTSGAKTQHILITTRARDADVTLLLGTAWLTPGTAGTPDVNVKLISGDATAADNLEAACDGTTYNIGGGAVVAASCTASTPALIADAVCDEVISTGHAVANSVGKIIYDNLNAPVATVDTVVDGIETHVHAIDAKTANLPASPAAVGSAMLITAGSGAGQLDVTSGVIKSNLAQILGTTITESVGGYLAAGFKKLLDVVTPVFTLASVNQSADNDTKLTAIKAKTDMQPSVWYSP